jgi:hypothetical protein
VDDIWPKGLSSARVGSLVRRSLHIGEFGRLFIPSKIGVITAINTVEDILVYDVLFLVGPEGEAGEFHTLRLFDEDLIVITW